jgi:hypothetical protein
MIFFSLTSASNSVPSFHPAFSTIFGGITTKKGQAVQSVIIIIGFFIAIFFVVSNFVTLTTLTTPTKPYIKSLLTTDNTFAQSTSFAYGQNFLLLFDVANPESGNFTPYFSLNYDSNCILGPLPQNSNFNFISPNIIYPKNESFFALNFTITSKGCNSSTSLIGLHLYRYLNGSAPLDYKTVSITLVQTTVTTNSIDQ